MKLQINLSIGANCTDMVGTLTIRRLLRLLLQICKIEHPTKVGVVAIKWVWLQ